MSIFSVEPLNELQGDLELSARHFHRLMHADFITGWLPMIDNFGGFYYNTSGRLLTKSIQFLIPFLGIRPSETWKCITNSDFRRRLLMDLVAQFDPLAVKMMASFGESPLNTIWLVSGIVFSEKIEF